MKKVMFFVVIIFVLVGCGENKIDNKITKIKSDKEDKKEYYVNVVKYVDHDDYYEIKKKHSNYVTPVKINNEEKEERKESVSVSKEPITNTLEMVFDDEPEENQINKKDEQATESEDKDDFNNNLTINEEEVVLSEEKENSETILSNNNTNVNQDTVNNQENKINEAVVIDGFYSPSGKYLGDTKVKVIDVSYYQGDINWDMFAQESDCYGVILRLGYWNTLDKKFERNINEVKRLNIPYGIYLFSYSTTVNGALTEARFTNEMFDKYGLDPKLGIYYDIESWSSSNGSSSNGITKEGYDKIISTYVNTVSSHVGSDYKVRVYSGRWYAMNRLGLVSKSYVDWVAEYNSTCKYDGSYSMWQYTSKGSVPGVNGNVDISYLY